MRAINTYAVAVARYIAGILKWTKEELEQHGPNKKKKVNNLWWTPKSKI